MRDCMRRNAPVSERKVVLENAKRRTVAAVQPGGSNHAENVARRAALAQQLLQTRVAAQVRQDAQLQNGHICGTMRQ